MTPVPAKKYKLMKIIIADDSSLWRDRIKSLLESINNVHVEGEAENGVEALQLIRKIEPDLAILDIRMPEMNGIEVLKKIREMGLQTKVCILTNYPYKQYKERCIAAGADYFFDKNLDIQQLLDIIFKLANNYERA
jgi:DNA-binding NarL/FixJ family response regulator